MDSTHIPDALKAWAPMIASGYECPAASTVMLAAAARIATLEAEKARLVEGLKYARRFLRPHDYDTDYLDALLNELGAE